MHEILQKGSGRFSAPLQQHDFNNTTKHMANSSERIRAQEKRRPALTAGTERLRVKLLSGQITGVLTQKALCFRVSRRNATWYNTRPTPWSGRAQDEPAAAVFNPAPLKRSVRL